METVLGILVYFGIPAVCIAIFGCWVHYVLKKNGIYKKRWFLLAAFWVLAGDIILLVSMDNTMRRNAYSLHGYMNDVYLEQFSYYSFLGSVIGGFVSVAVAFWIAAIYIRRKSKFKKCPKCAEKVRAEASVCRFCGHDFE